MPTKSEIATLHRYFLWARRCRTFFENAAAPRGPDPRMWFAEDAGMFLTRWYSALFVVVEGWKRLRCEDATIKDLLKSKNARRLRKVRNCICHYQPDYLDDHLLSFIETPESAAWAQALTDAFGEYFLNRDNADEGELGETLP